MPSRLLDEGKTLGPQLIRQPALQTQPRERGRSLQCGQTCLAILSGKPLAEICKLVGKNGRTSYKDLTPVLKHLGFHVGPKNLFNKVPIQKPYALIRVVGPLKPGTKYHRFSHWVLYWQGTVFDPATENNHLANYEEGTRFVSFVEIWEDLAGKENLPVFFQEPAKIPDRKDEPS